MKPSTKSTICSALRSGRFPQGQVEVTDGTSFCVGGVVLSLYAEHLGVKDGKDFACRIVSKSNELSMDIGVDERFLDWMGMEEKELCAFAEMTEMWNTQYSFTDIADRIEIFS